MPEDQLGRLSNYCVVCPSAEYLNSLAILTAPSFGRYLSQLFPFLVKSL